MVERSLQEEKGWVQVIQQQGPLGGQVKARGPTGTRPEMRLEHEVRSGKEGPCRTPCGTQVSPEYLQNTTRGSLSCVLETRMQRTYGSGEPPQEQNGQETFWVPPSLCSVYPLSQAVGLRTDTECKPNGRSGECWHFPCGQTDGLLGAEVCQ